MRCGWSDDRCTTCEPAHSFIVLDFEKESRRFGFPLSPLSLSLLSMSSEFVWILNFSWIQIYVYSIKSQQSPHDTKIRKPEARVFVGLSRPGCLLYPHDDMNMNPYESVKNITTSAFPFWPDTGSVTMAAGGRLSVHRRSPCDSCS